MQMSGHVHTLSASSPGNKEFVPMGNRVNPRASLDGAEKREISVYASTRTHNPWNSCLGLSTSSEQAYIAQMVRKRIKRISLFFITPEYHDVSFHNQNALFICVCVCVTHIICNACFVMYVQKAWYMIKLPSYPFTQTTFEFSQNFVHPCTTGQPLIVIVFQLPSNNINIAVT